MTRTRKPRARSLSGVPEEHRQRVAPLLAEAEENTRDAEASVRGGDCERAIDTLMTARGLLGTAWGHADSSGDATAKADVRGHKAEWGVVAGEIAARCVRKKPAKEDPMARSRLRR